MRISDFIAGAYVQRYKYKSFEANLVNQQWIVDNAELNYLLSLANIKLGELSAFSQLIPDVDFFIKMHQSKEGTQSSKIEGTQTNIDQTLQKIENIDPEKRDDWAEVHNYINAMNFAIAQLDHLPLSSRLLKQTHKILLEGARGTYKLPGEFRKSQNWIGGSSLYDAIFIPAHHDSIDVLMSDLESFLHNPNINVPDLIRIGIAHYQFETIHPFLDGNGRIGRLMITLFLVSNKLLSRAALYISDYFEKHRNLYYDNLTRVRTNNDMNQWLKFFLEAVRHSAENSIDTFKSILELRNQIEIKIISLGRKQILAKQLMIYLYSNPISDAADIAKYLGINISTALRLINDFIKLGILEEKTGFKRNRIFVFEEYMKLFRA
jgi:Fic family protein